MGYYYIQVQFVNGTVSGYRSNTQPSYSDAMESFILATEQGGTVWLPIKNVISIEWRFTEAPEPDGKED